MMIADDCALISCGTNHAPSSVPTALQAVRPSGWSIASLSRHNIGLWQGKEPPNDPRAHLRADAKHKPTRPSRRNDVGSSGAAWSYAAGAQRHPTRHFAVNTTPP